MSYTKKFKTCCRPNVTELKMQNLFGIIQFTIFRKYRTEYPSPADNFGIDA